MTGGPLAGVRVVEVGVFMAAPFATHAAGRPRSRGAQGREPRAAATRSGAPGRSWPARARRSCGSTGPRRRWPSTSSRDGGREAFLRLAERADVVVENLRPGAMRRLGLGYDEVRAVNPARRLRLRVRVRARPGRSRTAPGLDIMAQARGGLMSITGAPDGRAGQGRACRCATSSAGSTSRSAVTAALRERDRSGEGQSHRRVAARVGGLAGRVGGGPLVRHRRGRPTARLARTRARRRTRRCAPPTASSRSAPSRRRPGRPVPLARTSTRCWRTRGFADLQRRGTRLREELRRPHRGAHR